jgi:hypothetical protein
LIAQTKSIIAMISLYKSIKDVVFLSITIHKSALRLHTNAYQPIGNSMISKVSL